MKNPIAERIVDFLKNYPPFNSLNYQELLHIATEVRVLYLEKNKILFQIGDVCHDSFYIVASGAIGLSVTSDAEETLIDKCDEGDILGLRPFFAKNNYLMTAKAREESIVYAIPIHIFQPYVTANPDVLSFLLESFASNTRNPYDKEHRGKLISENIIYKEQQADIQYFQSIHYSKEPITAAPEAIVRDIAQMMTDKMIGSVIITSDDFPIGIVTDKDLRSKIATGHFQITTTASKIMTSPVITVPEDLSLAEAQLYMLKYNVDYLCVTEDGSDRSSVRGIISENDLVVAQANNPGVLIKEVKRAQSAKDLKRIREKLSELIQTSITKDIPLSHIMNISGEINTAITRRAIDLAILEMGSPPARFAWLSIGSQGRKEQLLLTDQDSFLVFEDVAQDKYRDVKDYFLRLARRTTSTLEKVGYFLSPDGSVASNMMWCKSLTDWIKQYNNWINTPGENSEAINSIFFDYEIAFGETSIEEAITEIIFKNVKGNKLFFDYLGNDALKKPPPLGFFRQFLVEEGGENKDTFDIKTRALMPLIDAGRLLILHQNIKGINNTYMRFKQLAIADSRNSELFLNCAEAFLTLSEFRTVEGLKNDSSGQFINLEELSKTDKVKLKNCFIPIKEVQELIKSRFKLTYFS
ncbi:inosine 5'-monophosphate dehydrogenase [compost metagenome]